MGGVFLSGALVLVVAVLLLYLFSLRSALKEVARELEDKLKTDTNTLISLSTGDRAVRTLAAQMNRQLQALRKERLKLQYGDAELRAAITNLSHDLRTPLTAIGGYLDLAERETLPEKVAGYLSVIRERTDTMRGLTEELFRYFVITGTAEALSREPVSLNDVLEQSVVGFYGAFSDRGIVPDIEMPEQPIIRMLDHTALRRVFDNILGNAARYSDGDLVIRLSADGDVWFENGAKKLDAVQTERLFDRFFTVNTASGGTGLGLSIARLLTEKMGGRMTAEYGEGRLKVCVRFSIEEWGRHNENHV